MNCCFNFFVYQEEKKRLLLKENNNSNKHSLFLAIKALQVSIIVSPALVSWLSFFLVTLVQIITALFGSKEVHTLIATGAVFQFHQVVVVAVSTITNTLTFIAFCPAVPYVTYKLW